jgi:translocation and assembly module TamB
MNKNISYSGEVNVAKVIGIDAKLVKPLSDLKIIYEGTLSAVNTQISAEGLEGSFVSSDMKKGVFHLETKEAIQVGQLVVLPAELNATKVNVLIDAPINFENLAAINGKAKITSNVANIDADIAYGKEIKAKITTTIPKDSLLINFDKNVHYTVISPLVTNITVGTKDIKVKVTSKKINADVMMKPLSKTLDGKIHIAGMTATMKAQPNGDVVIKSDVGSFASLLDTVKQFYTIEDLPKIDGKLNVSVLVKKNQDVTLSLTSPQVIYHADRKTDHEINDFKVVLGKKGDNLTLNSYKLSYDSLKLFATKPSLVKFDKSNIVISELWLNDQLKVTGILDTKTMKGQILADAPTFHLAHEMIDLDSVININTVLDGNSTDISGKVTLLGGDIHYDLATKTFPSDSDIVIVQDIKKEKDSPFMNNLTIAVNVDTNKPLVFKQGPINVQAKVNVGVHKAIFSDPMVIGSVDLVDGGSYVFQGKRFVLENSHVYFTGDPNKPMLDITVKYKTIKNSLITINITGTPAVPNILFSSVPSMSKEQILSIILFDSEEGAGSNSGEDMMKMMGGAMAKSALSHLGVKLDHLVIGEGNSVEVGKKIMDKVTVIYINGDIPEMKVKYDYSPSIEAVVGASERSESADIVYKKDFSSDDIVILGR